MHRSFVFLALVAGLSGCAHKPEGSTTTVASASEPTAARPSEKTASAQLEPRSGNSALTGEATFRSSVEGVTLVLHVTGAPPGVHGAHIHETGDCSDPEAKSAGGHWNPAGHKHGAPPPSSVHLGDLGNLTVTEDGTGHLELGSAEWKIGGGSPEDVLGKAIVIHGGPDDLASDPAGNSGPRIGCGVIH